MPRRQERECEGRTSAHCQRFIDMAATRSHYASLTAANANSPFTAISVSGADEKKHSADRRFPLQDGILVHFLIDLSNLITINASLHFRAPPTKPCWAWHAPLSHPANLFELSLWSLSKWPQLCVVYPLRVTFAGKMIKLCLHHRNRRMP